MLKSLRIMALLVVLVAPALAQDGSLEYPKTRKTDKYSKE